MSITLIPAADAASLRITGDIDTSFTIPADPSFGPGGERSAPAYYVALSDGTLLQALRQDDPNWEVITGGAATIEIAPGGRALTAHWGIEWATLATSCNARAVAKPSMLDLPRFHPDLDAVA